MITVKTEDGSVEVKKQFMEFAPGVDSGTYEVEVSTELFKEVVDFYDQFITLDDKIKVQLTIDGQSIEDLKNPGLDLIVDCYRAFSVKKQIEILEAARYMRAAPLTNLMCAIFASTI